MPEPPIASVVRHLPGHDVLVLAGPLSLTGSFTVRSLLDKLLAGRGRLAVEVAGVRPEWAPAVEVFPTALGAAGGWPSARMVLARPGPDLAAALRAARVPQVVPVLDRLAEAADALAVRPPRVSRLAELPADPGSVDRARVLVRQACLDWAAAERVEIAVLVAGELVSNAVQHSRTSCALALALDDRGLHVGVRDYGVPGTVHRSPAGRGLRVVALCSAAWGVTDHLDGKTVWAVIGP